TGPVDVVVVAAPIAAHLPLALAALESGADVLLEKPPVTTRADLATLLDAERRSGRVVQVGFQSLGSHALPALRDGSLVGTVRS
ncbi:Gfo/Idh/MocA family oxidoreductase, partial [Curtobacterium sp. CT11-45]